MIDQAMRARPAGIRPQPTPTLDAALESEDGTTIALPLRRWMGPVGAEERRLLRRARGPVLDVGCGPGRHAAYLRHRGIRALGIDVSPAAVRLALRRGAVALHRSIFESVPGEGTWTTVLLLDGNIGIGGDPAALLARVADVLAPGGSLLAEFDPPGRRHVTHTVRVRSTNRVGRAFSWSTVPVDSGAGIAGRTGFRLQEAWYDRGRWFAELTTPSVAGPDRRSAP